MTKSPPDTDTDVSDSSSTQTISDLQSQLDQKNQELEQKDQKIEELHKYTDEVIRNVKEREAAAASSFSEGNNNDTAIPTATGIAAPEIKHDPDSVVSALYNEATTSDRPVNVYQEKIKGIDIIWYNTEGGNEIGRRPVTRYDKNKKEYLKLGFDYTIRVTHKNIDSIIEQSFGQTKFYCKDKGQSNMVTEKEFRKALNAVAV